MFLATVVDVVVLVRSARFRFLSRFLRKAKCLGETVFLATVVDVVVLVRSARFMSSIVQPFVLQVVVAFQRQA